MIITAATSLAMVSSIPRAFSADSLTPTPIQQFFDNAGKPCVGCLLFSYQASTSTKLATYTNSGGLTQNTNPIVLDAAGRANIWLPAASTYKYVLAPATDTDPPTNPIWTVDQITNGTLGTLGIGAGLASSGGNLIICPTCVTNAMLAATTGAGSVVLAGGPTIVSPTLSGTVGGSGVIPNAALVNNTTTVGSTAIALGGTGATVAGLTLTAPTTNNGTFNSPTLVTPALGTIASGNLAAGTGYTIANLAGAGTGVLTFLATPSSANLATALTDETGTGAAVFASSPSLTTPALNNPTYSSLASTNGNAGICYVNASNTMSIAATACTGESDKRVKKDFAPVIGLDGIMRLNPVSFDWRDGRQGRTLGLTAQNVREVYPEAVEDTGDTTIRLPDGTTEVIHHNLGMHYEQLIAPLIQSVQELEGQVVALRMEVRRLKATNASLRR